MFYHIRYFLFRIICSLYISLLIGCSGKNKDDSDNASNEKAILKIGMITDVAGVNDQSFNQSAWEGLQKAKETLLVLVILPAINPTKYAAS